jgi:serine/threonine-protein kinase
LAGDRTTDPFVAGGTSVGSGSSGSRDYVPGATSYRPGSTGYNPPTSSYVPGSTGYNPPGIDRSSTGGSYYQSAPAGSGDDLPPYRPGGTSDVLRRSGTTSPAAGTSSFDPQGTAARRSDFDVAPVGYDAQPDTTLRR